MYGMVNDGVRSFIVENHGPDVWESICDKAGITEREFERMISYDDAVTYALVGAICDETGLGAAEVLEIFGRYWVGFAGKSTYGNLLKLTGSTLVERLGNLDDMHARIQNSMPHLQAPSFDLTHAGGDTYTLDYYSPREGLAPMVIGLLHGLAAETDEKIEVRQIGAKDETTDHDSFEITLLR